MEPIINQQVPEFKVQAYHNDKFITVTNKDIEGKWAIFFFYPADFTFVCPTELEDLASKYEGVQKMGVEVYSVSTDSQFVHKAWHDTSDRIKNINYPMIADPTGFLSRAFGVMIEDEGMAYRGTFVVDPKEKSRLPKSRTITSDEMPMSSSARFRLPSLWPRIPGMYVRLNGKREQRRLPSIDLVGKL